MALPMGTWSVTFDRPLLAGALNAANWTFNAGDEIRNATDATAAGNVVSGDSVTMVENAGPDVVNYAAAPADVVSDEDAMPAAAFSDFPLTVT